MNTAQLQFSLLLRNKVFLAAFFSLAGAQFIKAIVSVVRARKFDMERAMFTFLWRTGGMPSSHSAVVTSICVSIALTEGFSNLFALSVFVALIVIRDALGVRRSAGQQARELNRIGGELQKRFGIDYDAVKEVNGHTFSEVLAGCAIGAALALGFCLL